MAEQYDACGANAGERVRSGPLQIYAGAARDLRACLLVGFAFGSFLLTYGPRAYRGWRESRLLKRAAAMLAKEGSRRRQPRCARSACNPSRFARGISNSRRATEKQIGPKPSRGARRSRGSTAQSRSAVESRFGRAAFRSARYRAQRARKSSAPRIAIEPPITSSPAGWRAPRATMPKWKNISPPRSKQEPANDLYQFNLAVLRIRSADPEKTTSARKSSNA